MAEAPHAAYPAPGTPPPTPWPRNRLLVFALTWVSYASYYLGRKNLSVTKSRIISQTGITLDALVWIDTGYLIAYAIGQFASGILGDRFGSKRLVGFGMLVCAAASIGFGASSSATAMLVAFTLNGFAQSTGWPGTSKAVAQWTTRHDRGTVLGLWSTCYQVGGLAATALATWLLTTWGWRSAFFVPALWITAVGCAVLLLLPERPIGQSKELSIANAEGAMNQNTWGFLEVVRSATVWSFGLSYFCVKLIRYSLIFWLPYYLHTSLGYTERASGYLSTSLEIGGIVGSIAFGFISDKVRFLPRSVFATLGLVGLAVALALYPWIGSKGRGANFVAMALVGCLLFGPDALLGAAAQDYSGPYAAATAAGIVNGVGSLGAILQGVVTLGVSRRFGWNALFFLLLGLALMGALALAPTWRSTGHNQRIPDS